MQWQGTASVGGCPVSANAELHCVHDVECFICAVKVQWMPDGHRKAACSYQPLMCSDIGDCHLKLGC